VAKPLASSQAKRVGSWARLASPILALARAGGPDGPDGRAEPPLPGGEGVLDGGPHPAAAGVATGEVPRHRPAGHAARRAPQVADAATAGQEVDAGGRAVGGARPDAAGGVGRVQGRAELAAVVRRRARHGPGPDRPVRAVDAEVVLVAEHRRRDPRRLPFRPAILGGRSLAPALEGPARVAADLRPPGRRPAVRGAAAADHRLLLGREPGRAGLDGRRAHALATPPVARKPAARKAASERPNSRSTAPAFVSCCSRESRSVVASGTGSCRPSPTRRIKESRSRSRHSACPSESAQGVRRTGTSSIRTTGS
jgi:hypothetical protein